jgi:mitofilin
LFFSSSQASAGSENEFVSAVVGGIPPTALSRGVYTEQSLRERFTRVETVARRVGAIGDDGGSLLRLVFFLPLKI